MIFGMELSEIAAVVIIWHVFEFLVVGIIWELLKKIFRHFSEDISVPSQIT